MIRHQNYILITNYSFHIFLDLKLFSNNKLSKVSDKIRNFLKESPDATIEKVEAKVNVKENNAIDKLQENKIGKGRFVDLTRSQINLVNSIEKWAMENKITNDNNELLRYNEKAENKTIFPGCSSAKGKLLVLDI